MKFVALYKTWDGAEWIETSLASIYGGVDAIVLVHSELSWLGEQGNTVAPVVASWKSQHDSAGKIHELWANTTSQQKQYAAGVEYIRKTWGDDLLIMVVDADEIWTADDIDRARHHIAACTTQFPAYRCCMHTYLKTPFYQIDPPYGEPLCFFRPGDGATWLTTQPRGCGCPSGLLPGVWMHHFSYVRQSYEDVERKIRQSSTADGDERTANWRFDVWDRLPFGENLHGCARWRRVWHRIRPVFRHQIPQTVWQSEFMATFLPRHDSLMETEMDTIRELSRGLEVCIDLGTLGGTSAIIESLGAKIVHTFDLWEDVPTEAIREGTELRYRDFRQVTEDQARRNLSWYSNVVVHKADVVKAAADFGDQFADLVFVDADHSYFGTISAAKAWLPKLKPGGTLLFHDNNEGHPGVMQATAEVQAWPGMRKKVLPNQWPGSLVGFAREE